MASVREEVLANFRTRCETQAGLVQVVRNDPAEVDHMDRLPALEFDDGEEETVHAQTCRLHIELAIDVRIYAHHFPHDDTSNIGTVLNELLAGHIKAIIHNWSLIDPAIFDVKQIGVSEIDLDRFGGGSGYGQLTHQWLIKYHRSETDPNRRNP